MMLNKKKDRTKEFFEWYLSEFKMVKANYLTNRYLKEWISIPSETLRMKKKPKELIEAKKNLDTFFKSLIQKAQREGRIESIEKGRYILID